MESSELVLYFDGRCPLCVAQIRRLGARDAQQRLAFVDIAGPGFDPAPLGVGLTALNRELHARLPDGRMLTGVDGILAAHALTGRGWLVRLLGAPVVRGVLAPLYRALRAQPARRFAPARLSPRSGVRRAGVR